MSGYPLGVVIQQGDQWVRKKVSHHEDQADQGTKRTRGLGGLSGPVGKRYPPPWNLGIGKPSRRSGYPPPLLPEGPRYPPQQPPMGEAVMEYHSTHYRDHLENPYDILQTDRDSI